MSNLNCVNVIGRLTRDPESKSVGDTTVCNFNIALDIGFGEKKKAAFIEVTAWGKTAKFVQDFFTKGQEILITGRLDYDSWDDKDSGKKRSKVFITADRISFVGSKSEQSETVVASDDMETPPF